jgi:hypothetical protein
MLCQASPPRCRLMPHPMRAIRDCSTIHDGLPGVRIVNLLNCTAMGSSIQVIAMFGRLLPINRVAGLDVSWSDCPRAVKRSVAINPSPPIASSAAPQAPTHPRGSTRALQSPLRGRGRRPGSRHRGRHDWPLDRRSQRRARRSGAADQCHAGRLGLDYETEQREMPEEIGLSWPDEGQPPSVSG